jgi:hypothetical protein
VHLGDRRHSVGRDTKLLRGVGHTGKAALHQQHCRDELKAVHHPVIDFAGHQLGMRQGPARRYPEFQLIHHDRRQILQILDLILVDGARLGVDDAQRSKIKAVARAQRYTRVKPQAQLAGNERVCQGTGIDLCVVQDVDVRRQYRGRAQTRVAGNLVRGGAVVRLEPDAVVIDHADD